MATFTRDVLKWLQGLHLSHTYHMPKWDFANGYLIAEILSHQFPAEININSYLNGNSLEMKMDNWSRIVKICEKHQVPLTKEDSLAVMHGQPNAAVTLVQTLYVHFTHRKIHDLKKAPSLEFNPEFWTIFSFQLHDGSSQDIPHFRLPNTTSLMRAIPETEFRVTQDETYIKKRHEQILLWQEQALKHFSGSESPQTELVNQVDTAVENAVTNQTAAVTPAK